MLNLISSCNFSYPKEPYRNNEDSILTPKKVGDGYLLAVADGVGSYEGADKASKLVIEHIEHYSEKIIRSDFNYLFNDLKKILSDLDDLGLPRAATTLTLAYLNRKGLRIGHIGDCRLYVKNGKKLKLLTKDHTQYQKLLDEKIYTKKELKEIGGKNILTTAISKYIHMTFDDIFIPLSKLPIENGKITLFIMSDGAHSFWDNSPRFSEKTMSNVIKFSNSLLRRIERKLPTDDYSMVSAEFALPTDIW
ncbi:PP2C family protein-serine/threonine phosphatase [Gilliamella apicola]|uniref:PP2C family protein-serine/threonine phosphatase n=1 Tax=Gilliamella apicola TaxID=1196095 RepID=UPI000A33EBFD|nr:PP2C family serine/threonine-protein phosphatase [Gilliamella apicola]OTP93230.1 protein phosphatase [Gilliamella apicola]OTQ00202.1 protein phosphatase [Gilliamella apicola]OTQ31717.1 protein phosphatase [Gilliamella apicola]